MSATMTMTEDKELTLDEVAKRLRLSRMTVLRRIRAGRIRARQEGKLWRVRESDLEAYIESTYLEPEEPEEED